MRKFVSLSMCILFSGAVFANPGTQYWFEPSGGEYGAKIDSNTSYTRTNSALLYSIKNNESSKGYLVQTLKPCPGAPGLLKVQAYLQTENVGRAGLSVKVSSQIGITTYEHKDDETWGSTPWTFFEKNIEIPEYCDSVNVGIYLKGSGKVWVDDFNIERADQNDLPSKVSSELTYEGPDLIKSPGFEDGF